MEFGDERGDTHPGRDMPLFLAIVEGHDFAGTDARLPPAIANCEAQALRDNGIEVWQLFDILD